MRGKAGEGGTQAGRRRHPRRDSLLAQTAVGLSAAMVAVFVATVVLTKFVTIRGYEQLEDRIVRRNVGRAERALEHMAETLETQASDWAAWDDLYEFAAGGSGAFAEDNLDRESMGALKVSVIAVLGADGKIVHAAAVESAENIAAPFPPSLAALLADRRERLSRDDRHDVVRGVVQLPEGAMLVAIAPITRSDREGATRGRLVFGRWLDGRAIDSLGRLTELSLSVTPIGEVEGPARVAAARLLGGLPGPVASDGSHRVSGYALLRDFENQPALLLQATMAREVMLQGSRTVALFLGAVVLVCVATGTTVLLGLNRLVLRRLRRLGEGVARVTEGATAEGRVEEDGRDELGRLAGDINSMLDVLERQERELNQKARELEQARSVAEGASRAKDDFLANMSHEIRTPMTAILGFAGLLSEEGLEHGTREEYAETIRRNGEHLLQMINDVLDLSKIGAGMLHYEPEDCDAVRVVEEVRSLMLVRSGAKGLELKVVYDNPLPRTVRADPLRLRQVLVNMVGNAIKFTEEGRVRIELRVTGEVGGGNPMLEVSVSDTGIGMTPAQMSRLFRPFVQADSSLTRRFGGTGLGLVISRRLTEMMGGSLSVRSREGEGSEFSLRLPMEGAGEMADAPWPGASWRLTDKLDKSGPGLSAHVLLVEDGLDNQRLISHRLRRAGATVEVVANGEQAIQRLAPDNGAAVTGVDLVLLDMQMPVMDGYAAATELRRRGYAGPIIALTAHAMSGDRDRCLSAGCTAYLTKPISAADLIGACAAVLAAHQERGAA